MQSSIYRSDGYVSTRPNLRPSFSPVTALAILRNVAGVKSLRVLGLEAEGNP